MSVEFFVRLRDACDAEIERLKPKEIKDSKKPSDAQFNGLKWVQKEGTRGAYDQTENDKTENFRVVSQYVKAKGGFCNLYGFKTWLHNQDENLIDRKK